MRRGTAILSVLILAALASAAPVTSVMAGHGPDSTVLTITAAYGRELMNQGQKLLFIDLRPRAEFQKGHLPGARSVPLDEIRRRVQEIPKSGLVVLYCACPPKDVEGAYLFLRDQSYRTIAVMEDGFAAWVSQGYPIER